jgi:hypothetical protein
MIDAPEHDQGWRKADVVASASRSETQGPVRIVATSNADAELFLVRHDLSLAANGVGRFETLQPRGLYKLRAIRAGRTKEALIEAVGDMVEHHLAIDDVQTIGPSRAVLGVKEDMFVNAMSSTPLRRLPAKWGHAGAAPTTLLVVGSQTHESGDEPLKGVLIRPWRSGGRGTTLTRERQAAFPAAGRLWAAAVVQAECRRWTIDIEIDGRRFRLSLPVLRGRQTQLFLRRRLMSAAEESTESPTARSRTWLDLAFSFAPTGDAPPQDWRAMLGAEGQVVPPETAEAFRQALTRGRRLVMSDSDIMQLLRVKSADPYVGIAGAHLMLDAIEAAAERRRSGRAMGSLDAMTFSPTSVRQPRRAVRRQIGGRRRADGPRPCRRAAPRGVAGRRERAGGDRRTAALPEVLGRDVGAGRQGFVGLD